MQAELQKNIYALELGRQGSRRRIEQLNAQERGALAKHAARSPWHPCEAQASREQAQELAYLVQKALKTASNYPSSDTDLKYILHDNTLINTPLDNCWAIHRMVLLYPDRFIGCYQ